MYYDITEWLVPEQITVLNLAQDNFSDHEFLLKKLYISSSLELHKLMCNLLNNPV